MICAPHRARPAPAFDDRGTLKIGAPADVAIIELTEGPLEFLDNYKARAPATSGSFPPRPCVCPQADASTRVASRLPTRAWRGRAPPASG